MRLSLHIGTDKTGSTSIQGHLHTNRNWLLDHGVYLPSTGFGHRIGHRGLLANMDEAGLEALAAELTQARQDGYSAALLSWEGMTFYSDEDIGRLWSILADYPVTVLVYLREQADIIQSGFLQRIKAQTNRLRIEVYEFPESREERRISRMERRPDTRNYYKLLLRWQKNMPGADFLVREYHREALAGGDVVQDFFEQLGLPLDAEFNRAREEDNPSLDVESAFALQAWQDKGLSRARLDRLLDIAYSRVSRDGPATRYFLSEGAVRSIRKHYRSSNRRLAKRFMPGVKYPFRYEEGCWRSEPLEAIRERAALFAESCDEVDRTPTLVGMVGGEELADSVELAEGWCSPASWGVWSEGPVSRIRFRLPRKHMPLSCSHIRLQLGGSYFGPNTCTQIVVNGEDFGQHELTGSGGKIDLPVDKLLPYEILELELRHQQPVSAFELGQSQDRRPIAFGVKKLGCAWVLEEDRPAARPKILTAGVTQGAC